MKHPTLIERTLHTLTERWWLLLTLFVGVFAPLTLFGYLAQEVWERDGFWWDAPILWAVHNHLPSALTGVMITLTKLGGALPMAACGALLIAALLWRRHYAPGLFAAIAIGGAASINLLAKVLFQRQRPTLWPQLAPETDYGFPSGHAMGTLAIVATLVLLLWATRWRWPVAVVGGAFVVLVSLSRLYLGVHYPSDILAGWCASLAWVTGTHAVLIAPLAWWKVRLGRLLKRQALPDLT